MVRFESGKFDHLYRWVHIYFFNQVKYWICTWRIIIVLKDELCREGEGRPLVSMPRGADLLNAAALAVRLMG